VRRARRSARVEHRQRPSQGIGLRLPVMGFACGMPKGEVGPVKSSYRGLLDNIPRATHDDRGDACVFQMTCDQTDRLVADGSRGYK